MTATLDRRADYVSAVAVELADLPAEERGELIEELDDHVAALLEDRPEVDLVGELGTPRAYAAELRAAAGLVGSGPVARPSVRQRWRSLVARVDARAPRVRPFLRLMRPVWWVLRGALVGLVLATVLGFGARSGEGLVLLALGVAGSTWLAQRPHPSRALRRGVLLLDVAAVAALAWAALWVGPLADSGYAPVQYDTQYVPNCPVELDNLYAYDASGQPLRDVRLYDQNGTPFDIGQFGCNLGGQFSPGAGGTNAYPWPSASYGQDLTPTGPPSSLAPLPGATVPSGATPAPTPSVTGTP